MKFSPLESLTVIKQGAFGDYLDSFAELSCEKQLEKLEGDFQVVKVHGVSPVSGAAFKNSLEQDTWKRDISIQISRVARIIREKKMEKAKIGYGEGIKIVSKNIWERVSRLFTRDGLREVFSPEEKRGRFANVHFPDPMTEYESLF